MPPGWMALRLSPGSGCARSSSLMPLHHPPRRHRQPAMLVRNDPIAKDRQLRLQAQERHTLLNPACLLGSASGRQLFNGIQLVELTAVIEVHFLRFRQRAKVVAHGEQLHGFEHVAVFFEYGG